MSKTSLLVVQIPCFNEEQTLAQTLADIPRVIPGFDRVEILVIDDGSSDRTVEVARSNGVHHIVSLGRNRGLAVAYMAGVHAALELGADVIVNTDADNQYVGSCIIDLVQPILDGTADMVIGERPIENIQEFSRIKKILQRLGSAVVRGFSGTDVRDAASGFRAVTRDTAMRLRVFGRYSYTMETLVQAGWEGLRVSSVPIRVNPATRPSHLVRSIPRYIVRSGSAIVRSFVLYNPFRFFMIIGTPFFLLGLALVLRWGADYFFAYTTSSKLPSLLAGLGAMLFAIQIWAVAFVADLLSVNRRLLSEIQFGARTQQFSAGHARDQ